jgi:hypothetical protein
MIFLVMGIETSGINDYLQGDSSMAEGLLNVWNKTLNMY